MSLVTFAPSTEIRVEVQEQAPRLATIQGAHIGILRNAKDNANELLQAIAARLIEDHGAVDVVTLVTGEGMLGTTAQFDVLAASCNLVLSGVGDCGSCSGCVVHNATEMERRGVPAIAVCTTPFGPSASHMAVRRGFPGYRSLFVEHPISSATAEGVARRAQLAVPKVLDIVLALRPGLA